ncbi:MAG: tandem-95 repeat protein, partial [Planctomycetales bacterium]|nr:tandem-95 repeat protein [Planctomycetales bacterium]
LAQSLGGHLVAITSLEEQQFLNDWLAPQNRDYWIGLRDGDGSNTFQWDSGETLDYTNWFSGYPSGNDDGVAFRPNNGGQWYNTNVGNNLGAVIEIVGNDDRDLDGIPDVIDNRPDDELNGWELRAAGVDGIFDSPDDVSYDVRASYDGNVGISVTIADGPLPPGEYRLTITDTLIDTAGNPLDGDRDGTAGGDFVQFFSVDPFPNAYTLETPNNNSSCGASPLSFNEDPPGSGLFVGRGIGSQDPYGGNVWTDEDWWSFAVEEGDTIALAVDDLTGGMNLYLELYDPAGNYITADDNSGPGPNAYLSNYTVAATGTYYARIGNWNSGPGTYQLRVEIARDVQLESDAQYNNNGTGNADPLTYQTIDTRRSASVAGTLMAGESGNVDADYFNLGTIEAGETILLSTRRPLDSQLRPFVEIRDANDQVVSIATNPSDAVARADVSTTGTYYAVMLAGSGHGPFGQYLLDIAIQPTSELDFADLAVTDASVPAEVQSGETINLSWTVGNFGAVPTSVNTWSDRVVLSVNDRYGDADDIQLATRVHTGAIGVNETYTVNTTAALPLGLFGTFFVLIQTDASLSVPEFIFESNNVFELATPITITPIPTADLRVSDVQAPTETPIAQPITVTWKVDNLGTGTTNNGRPDGPVSSWIDRIYFSRNALLGDQDDVLVASEVHDGPLAPNEGYTGTWTGTLPAQLEGAYHVFVQTDATEAIVQIDNAAADVAEASHTILVSQVTVSDLQVSAVSAAPTASPGATLLVEWTVTNTPNASGPTPVSTWSDRIVLSSDNVLGNPDDRILGTFTHSGALAVEASYQGSANVTVPANISGTYNLYVITDTNNQVNELIYEDNNVSAATPIEIVLADLTVTSVSVDPQSATFGQVISITYRVENQGTGPAAATYSDRVYLSRDGSLGSAEILATVVADNLPLEPGQGYDRTLIIPTPLKASLTDGAYQIVVRTDDAKQLLESNETDASNVRGTTINLIQPAAADLEVRDVAGPELLQPGQSGTVTWTVTNVGERTAISDDASSSWTDRVYLSTTGLLFGATLLGQRTYTGTLAAGNSYQASLDFTLPSIADGNQFLIVVTDHTDHVYELGRDANNQSTSDTTVEIRHSDLVPTVTDSPTQVASGQNVAITWTTRNIGAVPTLTGFTERVYLSQDQTISTNDRLLASAEHSTLDAGASVDTTRSIDIPIDVAGDWFLLVQTDATDALQETGSEGNNVASRAIAITLAPYADLEVSNVQAPELLIGDPATATFTWTVTNVGVGPGLTDNWVDAIIASRDDTIGNGDDRVLARFPHAGALEVGQSYTRTESVQLPGALEGRFNLYVVADHDQSVFENDSEANNRAKDPQLFDVTPIPYADLVVDSVTPDSVGFSGQVFTLSWIVSNRGLDTTNKSNWNDHVYLAQNADGTGRTQLTDITSGAAFSHIGFLQQGNRYTRTGQVRIPDGISGTYFFVVQTGGPYEFIYTDNNETVSGPVNIELSPPPDLIVTDIVAPENASEGSAIDITWTVKNDGVGTASGPWTDQVILRKFGETKGTTVGTYTYQGPLDAGLSYSRREQIQLPLHINNEYEIVVLTDSSDNVFEHTFEGNNQRTDDRTIQVSVLPRPDLQISEITGPSVVDAGGTASIEFVVINQGTVATTAPNWTDSVYLSLDDKVSVDDTLVSSLQNGAALEPQESYRSVSSTFQIPKRYRGTVYVIVVADAGQSLDEFPNERNNEVLHELFVNPWPFADLVVSDVQAPSFAVEGATFNVGYTVTNLGSGPTDRGDWTEQIWLTKDRNRPHPGQGDVLLTTLQYANGELVRDAGYDREGLSVTLPSSLTSGTYYITPWVDPYAQVEEDTLAINVNPDDPNEFDNNNYKARPIDILGTPPPPADIAVTAVSPDAAGLAGTVFEVSWEVENVGVGQTRAGWEDRVYLSRTPNLNDVGSQSILLGTFENVKALQPGEAYNNTHVFQLNPANFGSYVIVRSSLNDEDLDNNILNAATSVLRNDPDLVITDFTLEPSAISGETSVVRYTIRNDSPYAIWEGTQYWTDQLYFSKDAAIPSGSGSYDFANPVVRFANVASITQPNAIPLAPGESITREVPISLPKGIEGSYYVHLTINDRLSASEWPVPANAAGFDRRAYEDSTSNRVSGVLPVIYQEPDLVVSNVVVPDNLTAGQTFEVEYTVTNNGSRDTREELWFDRFFLSIDPTLDSQDYRLDYLNDSNRYVASEVKHEGILREGDSYTGTVTITLPFEIQGDFHLIAYVDAGTGQQGVDRSSRFPSNIASGLPGIAGNGIGHVAEFLDEGNNETATPITIAPLVPPDLQVTEIVVPVEATRGQFLDLSFTVTNFGGDTLPLQTAWDDLVYLSRDQFLDTRADRFLGTVRHDGTILSGGSYTANQSFRVPTDLPTDPANPLQQVEYYVFVVTDPARTNATGSVFEGGNERNNDRVSDLVRIVFPPPSDLVVTSIASPATARSGEPVEISWTVTNQSTEAVSGTWSDAVYLSLDATWDIDDRPMGRFAHSDTILPGESYTQTITVALPTATPGEYRVIVRTDIFNQVFELEKDLNNTTASPNATSVRVDELFVAIPETLAVKPGDEKLYQITVPNNQTLRIRIAADDKQSTNEVFVRYDQAPSSAAFDATYDGFLSSDPTVIVPSTRPGVYYVLVRGFSGPASGANIRIIADLLPLVITDVRTDTGGDAKYVTTTIEGAQFRDGAIVKLVRPGIAEYEPVLWDVIDSSKIIAKFDFTDAPHGLYDLKVINPDGSEAIIPYRFMIERAIEPDVTIGIGGPRVILAGDQATYSIAFQNISNVDAPYTYFQYGAPELLLNEYVYGLPYLNYFTNLRGTPEGAAGSENESVPWARLDSITNTDGQFSTSGFLYDQAADGFAGLSFNIVTYPGLRELSDRAFDDFRSQMSGRFPELDSILEEGGESAIGDWWDAVKDKADQAAPGIGQVLDQLDFQGLYESNVAVPGKCEVVFIPYRLHAFAAATSMTREEYVAFQSQQARDMRQAILDSDDAPGALLALAGDEQAWVALYLAALEDAGLLTSDGEIPPIREQQYIASLMSTIASGILFGPAGTNVRSDADLLGFFDQIRTLYGHTDGTLAPHELEERQCEDGVVGDVKHSIPPDFEDYDLGLSNATHFEAFRIYVPWIGFDERAAGLPVDFQINGPEPVDGTGFESLDFTDLLSGSGTVQSLASITGPQTFDTQGWIPDRADLPFTIQFENDSASGRFVNEVRVVSSIDEGLDGFSFELGDIQIGSIKVDIPAGKSLYQGEFDFTESNGFILRVTAGIDLYQEDLPVATWTLQAIDPLTGELLQSSTRGLLRPNNALGEGAGFVSYSIKPDVRVSTGDTISASARVLFDTAAPEDTQTITYMLDPVAPTSHISVSRIAADVNTFDVEWSAEDDLAGSGFKHVTLYVAEDGGDFKIWQRKLSNANGMLVYEGQPGHTYEFLALATDIAGNREEPAFGVNAVDDGSAVSFGGLPSVGPTTPPNFGQAPEPTPVPSTNPLFAEAENQIPNIPPSTRPSEFSSVIAPLVGQAFATGIPGSHADIGPMAIVEVPADGALGEQFSQLGIAGTFIVSGGANRGQLFRFDINGGEAETPFAELDDPIFNLAFDNQGRLWATTGGGPLLQLDPATGEVLDRFGDGLTIALAPDPITGQIYVSSNNGIEIFDPETGDFSHYSRDVNLRVGSLAFDRFGTLWATTWPDRSQVVRFNERGRAELMLNFTAPIDSLAFGQAATDLEDLLFITANAGEVADTGLAANGSSLTMVDTASLRRVVIATGGTRGDSIITTSDGRILLSQSHQVDIISPAVAPIVVATNPPREAAVALPLPFVSVTFDQDMLVGNADDPGSVINPDNYALVGENTGTHAIRSVQYDARTRTVLLQFDGMLADQYALTVRDVRSVFGLSLTADYTTSFLGISDLSALVDVSFGLARSDRRDSTISYEVTIRNTSDLPVVLPVLLTLDPAAGYTGLPTSNAGRTDDGKWLVDLSASLPPNGRLEPNSSTTGHTISIVTPEHRRIQFAAGLIGQTTPNSAPSFDSNPTLVASVGLEYRYDAIATDPDGQSVVYYLLSGPDGMTIDETTGRVRWLPNPLAAEVEPVTLLAFDTRGAAALQRFTIRLAGGNQDPEIVGLPEELQVQEGKSIQFRLQAVDADEDPLTVWADNLPPGASFDTPTRTFTWSPDYESAGTYEFNFYVNDRVVTTSKTMRIVVLPGLAPLELLRPADRTLREGERIRFNLRASGGSGDYSFASPNLPSGAILFPETGLVEWTPGYIQNGVYDVQFVVSDGIQTALVTTTLTVLNVNGDPVWDPQANWRTYEGQIIQFTAYAFDPDNPWYEPAFRGDDGNVIDVSLSAKSVVVEAISLPPGATFDTDTWLFQWTPDYLQAGTYEARFRATDDGNGTGTPSTIEMTVPIEVLNLNRRPELQQPGNVTVALGDTLDVIVHATDIENNPITMSATSESPGFPLPEFMSFVDNGNGTGRLRITPRVGDRGDHAITIIATDNGDDHPDRPLSDTISFVVTVESPNEPPVLEYLGPAVALVGQTLQVPVRVSDRDQEPLAYLLQGLPAGATLVPSTIYGRADLMWTPSAADIGVHTATVIVTDGGNQGVTSSLSDSATFDIVVRSSNAAPVLDDIGGLIVTEGATLNKTILASDDDNDPLTYSAAGLPEGARLDPVTGILSFVPRSNQQGIYEVTFTASDGNARDEQVVSLTVANSNSAPRFVPLSNQTAREGAELRFSVVAADLDADPLAYSVSSSLPDGALFVPGRGEFVWTPDFEQAGTYTITFLAQDPEGASDTLDLDITVFDINRPPVLNESNHLFLLGETKSFTVKASDPDGTQLTYSADDLPEGATLDPLSGVFSWTPGPGQAGEYLVRLTASDGRVATRQTVVLRASLEQIPPTVRIEQTPSFPATPGQQVIVSVQAEGVLGGQFDIQSMTLSLNGNPIALDVVRPGLARATITASAPGKFALVATATDTDGVEGTYETFLKVRDPGDSNPPLVMLSDHLSGAVISEETDVVGLVADVNLDAWELSLIDGLSGTRVLLARGDALPNANSSVAGLPGTLASVDPHYFVNGFHTLELSATDIAGRTSRVRQLVEFSTSSKLGQYARTDVDASVVFGGYTFDLTRRYDSLQSTNDLFGSAWTWADRDVAIHTNVALTGHEDRGIYGAFSDDTRLYVTLPAGTLAGQRVAFQFVPIAEQVGNLTFFRPAWQALHPADGTGPQHGFQMESAGGLLTRVGGRYYSADNGLPYHPQSGHFDGPAYTLHGTDGTSYYIADDTITEIVAGSGDRLFISDSSVTHQQTGDSLQIIRDGHGRGIRVVTPDETSVVYQYDQAGQLVLVRNLITGEGVRYGYADGRLVSFAVAGGEAGVVEYSDD